MADYLADVELPPQTEEEPSPEPEPEEVEYDETSPQSEEEEEKLPPVIKEIKEKIKKEDIFKKKPPPEIPEDIPPRVQPKERPKKKRVLTQAQKDGLAKGRAKQAENRRLKKLAKEESKAKEPPVPKVALARTHSVSYTLEDLENATEKAIEKYDAKRKARKAVKKKEQAKEKHDEKVFKDINNALTRQSDPWSVCFQ